jgi:hypothetical protein
MKAMVSYETNSALLKYIYSVSFCSYCRHINVFPMDSCGHVNKSSILHERSNFWDVMPRSLLEPNRWFGETSLHIFKVNEKAMQETSDHLYAGFLFLSFFDTEDGGDMFLRNVCWVQMDYATLYPRRQNSSHPQLWELQFISFFILMNIISKWPDLLLSIKEKLKETSNIKLTY